jgi:hypothetical protein
MRRELSASMRSSEPQLKVWLTPSRYEQGDEPRSLRPRVRSADERAVNLVRARLPVVWIGNNGGAFLSSRGPDRAPSGPRQVLGAELPTGLEVVGRVPGSMAASGPLCPYLPMLPTTVASRLIVINRPASRATFGLRRIDCGKGCYRQDSANATQIVGSNLVAAICR